MNFAHSMKREKLLLLFLMISSHKKIKTLQTVQPVNWNQILSLFQWIRPFINNQALNHIFVRKINCKIKMRMHAVGMVGVCICTSRFIIKCPA